MQPVEMNRLIEAHLAAEAAADTNGCVAMYTDDVIHDVVGAPHGPLSGPQAARGFYEMLTTNLETERMDVNRAWYGADFCVIEHQWYGSVPGEFLGVAGQGKRISFRMLHLWEFKDQRMSRENVWLDAGSIIRQLTSADSEP
ncbi:MAG TPA: ester cyclase [Acidimicrobiales bacterium]